MSRMIAQILDLTRSRLGAGLPIERSPVDLREVLKQVVEELRIAAPARAIVLECELPDPVGEWDKDRLAQVFSNIAGNAVHYGAPEQPVTVRAYQDDISVTVVVHNEGPVIPDAVLQRLFDPFRRGDRESRTARTEGLGLGLYISREIVIAHGGSIQAESSARSGTEFRVTLPRLENQRKVADS